MRLPEPLHSWRLSPRQAIALQRRLAPRVSRARPRKLYRWVAGLDAAFSPDGRLCLGAVVMWDVESCAVCEQHLAVRPVRFPYVPGLLSFREAPVLLAALRKLERTPDLLLCDGQGLAHPRRFGIASHLGLWCRLPAVGCAKSRLTGQHDSPGSSRGDRTPLTDAGEEIGAVLRTQRGVKPVYVSIGHRIDLDTACRVVLTCCTQFRLPEPTRLADRLVARHRRLRAP